MGVCESRSTIGIIDDPVETPEDRPFGFRNEVGEYPMKSERAQSLVHWEKWVRLTEDSWGEETKEETKLDDSLLTPAQLASRVAEQVISQVVAKVTGSYPCESCLGDFPKEEIFWFSGCQHRERFCLNCMRVHLRTQIGSFSGKLTCPLKECGVTLPDSVLSLLEKETAQFMSWQQGVRRHLLGSSDLIECPQCRRMIGLDRVCLEAECPYCQHNFCTVCRRTKTWWSRIWSHQCDPEKGFQMWAKEQTNKPGYLCEQGYQQTYQLKICPDCQTPYQKMNLCPEVTCKKADCNRIFYWNDAAPYQPDQKSKALEK